MKYITALICSIFLISCDNGTTIIPVNDFSFSVRKNENKDLIVLHEVDYLLEIDAVEKGSKYNLKIDSNRNNDLTFTINNTEYKTGDDIPILADTENITITTSAEDIGNHDLSFTLVKVLDTLAGSSVSEEDLTEEISLAIEVETPDFILDAFSSSNFQTTFPDRTFINLRNIYDETFIDPYFDFSLLKTQGNFKIEYDSLNGDNIEIQNGSFPLFENGGISTNGGTVTPYYLLIITPLDNQTGQLKFTIKATDQYGVSKSIDVTIQVIAS